MMLSLSQIRELARGNESPQYKFVVFSCGEKNPAYYIGHLLCPSENATLPQLDEWSYKYQPNFIALTEKFTPQTITVSSIDRFQILDDVAEKEFEKSGLKKEDYYSPFGFPTYDFREYLRRAFSLKARDLWDYRQLYSDYYAELFNAEKVKSQLNTPSEGDTKP